MSNGSESTEKISALLCCKWAFKSKEKIQRLHSVLECVIVRNGSVVTCLMLLPLTSRSSWSFTSTMLLITRTVHVVLLFTSSPTRVLISKHLKEAYTNLQCFHKVVTLLFTLRRWLSAYQRRDRSCSMVVSILLETKRNSLWKVWAQMQRTRANRHMSTMWPTMSGDGSCARNLAPSKKSLSSAGLKDWPIKCRRSLITVYLQCG